MSAQVEGVTGAITVAVFGISGTFLPSDFSAWNEVLMSGAPLLLILFLIWRIHCVDKRHMECTANWMKTQEQLALTYRALQDSQVRRNLPPEQAFLDNNFCLSDHPTKEK